MKCYTQLRNCVLVKGSTELSQKLRWNAMSLNRLGTGIKVPNIFSFTDIVSSYIK